MSEDHQVLFKEENDDVVHPKWNADEREMPEGFTHEYCLRMVSTVKSISDVPGSCRSHYGVMQELMQRLACERLASRLSSVTDLPAHCKKWLAAPNAAKEFEGTLGNEKMNVSKYDYCLQYASAVGSMSDLPKECKLSEFGLTRELYRHLACNRLASKLEMVEELPSDCKKFADAVGIIEKKKF